MLKEEEKKAIEWFKSDLEMTKEMGKRWGFQEEIKNNEIILNLVEKQQKEIERIKNIDIYKLVEDWETGQLIPKSKINEKLKELEEQKEKLQFDGNVCFADYEQFCKNLKFFKEQIEEVLEENTNE